MKNFYVLTCAFLIGLFTSACMTDASVAAKSVDFDTGVGIFAGVDVYDAPTLIQLQGILPQVWTGFRKPYVPNTDVKSELFERNYRARRHYENPIQATNRTDKGKPTIRLLS